MQISFRMLNGTVSPSGEEGMPRRSREEWTRPQPISIEVGGVSHMGHYQLELPRPSQPERRFIRVTDGEGEKKAHLGGFASMPEALARLLLSELIGNPQSREK
jgi:hypothetical protein